MKLMDIGGPVFNVFYDSNSVIQLTGNSVNLNLWSLMYPKAVFYAIYYSILCTTNIWDDLYNNIQSYANIPLLC